MSIAGLKVTLKSYLNFDYGIAGVISILIFCVYLFSRKQQRSQGQSVSKKDILCGLALSIYLAILISGTILNRSIGDEYQVELVPFWSYAELLAKWKKMLFMQIITNILMFIPWGILFPMVSTKMQKFRWNVGSALLFSIVIEVIQLVFKCGLFEFDDMFHNTLGAVIGYGVWSGIKKKKETKDGISKR